MLADKLEKPNLNFVFLLMGPLLLVIPIVHLQPTASEDIKPYSGLITFTVLGIQAFIVSYFAKHSGQHPFNWTTIPSIRHVKPIFFWSAIAVFAVFSISIIASALNIPSNVYAYFGLAAVGVITFRILLETHSVLAVAIVHFASNTLAVITNLQYLPGVIRTLETLVFAPLAEEQIKISFALGVAILFMSPSASKKRMLIGMAVGYTTATLIWIYSHCVVYPLSILPC